MDEADGPITICFPSSSAAELLGQPRDGGRHTASAVPRAVRGVDAALQLIQHVRSGDELMIAVDLRANESVLLASPSVCQRRVSTAVSSETHDMWLALCFRKYIPFLSLSLCAPRCRPGRRL